LDKNFLPENWYSHHYSSINESANPNSRAFKYLHNSLEKSCPDGKYSKVLEVGANNGEHIPFVLKPWFIYKAIDLRLPSEEIRFYF